MRRAFFPGKFDPIHNGQVEIARRAARLFDELIVAVSDYHFDQPVFNLEERIDMVCRSFPDVPNIHVIGYHGLTVDECLAQGARIIVGGMGIFTEFEDQFRLAQVRHHMKAEIEVVVLISGSETNFLSSELVRGIASRGDDVSDIVPGHVSEALKKRYYMEQA